MHIDNDALVGTYVSDKYSEKGTVTIVLTDGDSTPTKEYTRYKYVQTEQLTAIGVAVKDYGAVLVPETTIELFESGVLNAADFGVFVKFNDDYYSVSLYQLLAAIVSAPIEFEENSFDDYPSVTFLSTLPPFSVGNAGQVPIVDENGKVGWGDIPEELPAVTGNTGKFLGVNDGATGVEWKNVPNELPAIGDSDAGKVLKVNAEHTGVEWGEIPNELPGTSSASIGDMLALDADKIPIWKTSANDNYYLHQIRLDFPDSRGFAQFVIISTDSVAYSRDTFFAHLTQIGNPFLKCYGAILNSNSLIQGVSYIPFISTLSVNTITFTINDGAISIGEGSGPSFNISGINVNDNVIKAKIGT